MRNPAVSGFFYPNSEEEIRSLFSSFLKDIGTVEPTGRIIGVIVPHAGYVYSGKTAMAAYAHLKNETRKKFVIIGPNHSGYPRNASIYMDDYWVTPMGKARVMNEAGEKLLMTSPVVIKDNHSHIQEHSIEVQIPFLQYFFGSDFSFLPIILGSQTRDVSKLLSDSLVEMMDDTLLIASSDLTHYEPQENVVSKDKELIKEIESLDIDSFYSTLLSRNISACGYGAIATLMDVTKRKGGIIKLIDHSTSGDSSGDYKSVVGYTSMVAYIE